MSELHKFFGYPIPVGFGLLALWAIYSLVRNKQPHEWFWSLLGVMQALVAVQVVVGVILLLFGRVPPTSPAWLHYAYGGLFPAALLIGAHRLGQTRFEGVPSLPFGIASFLICGLTVRALMTGLGA